MEVKMIQRRLEENGFTPDSGLAGKLAVYLEMLQEWNCRMDLTAVADDAEILDRHFLDSLCPLKTGLVPEEGSLIDVGTGAGFPGLVLAMACPGLRVTLLDAQQKRLNFLEAVCAAAGIRNAETVHLRAEDGARKSEMRERFDIAAARAVAPANILCEYLLPYVRTGGYALCWKGPALKEETESGRRAAFLLGGQMEEPIAYGIAGRDWEHLLLPVRKDRPTPKAYPRKAGIPKQKPLGV